MDILGIGPLEIIFIILIAIIIFGPKDLVNAGRSLGKLLRQLIKSPTWKAIQDTSRELRNIPTRLVREAGLDEDMKDIQTILPKKSDLNSMNLDLNNSKTDRQATGLQSSESGTDEFSEWLTPPPSPAIASKSNQSSNSITEEQV
jgi:sec-independent protein translocase protein TatB